MSDRTTSGSTETMFQRFLAAGAEPPPVPRPVGAGGRRPGAGRRPARRLRQEGRRGAGGRRRRRPPPRRRRSRCGSRTGRSTSTRRPCPTSPRRPASAVEYNEDVNDNNEFFAKIDEPLKRNQSIDRDIVVLTDWMAGGMIALGYCAPLDDAKFPNKANLVDSLRDVSFDPGRKYSVPWVSGMTGHRLQPEEDRPRARPASRTSSTRSSRAR